MADWALRNHEFASTCTFATQVYVCFGVLWKDHDTCLAFGVAVS